jgi:Chaperone of endosialidase
MYSPVFFTFKPSPTGRVLRGSSLPLMVTLALFAVLPSARGVTPAPDGGYPKQNTAEGNNALFSLTTGSENTAIGFDTLFSNNSGGQNTATGTYALFSNKAHGDTAIGARTLQSNTSGGYNTAIGDEALLSQMDGDYNVGCGVSALHENTAGQHNTACGSFALYSNEGSGNVALGFDAGSHLTTGSDNIDIGNIAVAGDSGKIRIGTKGIHNGTFIAGISGLAVTGSQVIVNSNGKLGVTASSVRFKKAIKPMDNASEAILGLKPVTFRYKEDIDPDGILQFGAIAEEVEKVHPDLVARDAEGKVTTVRYEAVNAMLLNEFLREHRKVLELEKDLRATIAIQQKQIEVLTAGLQKVTAQIETGTPAPRIAIRN